MSISYYEPNDLEFIYMKGYDKGKSKKLKELIPFKELDKSLINAGLTDWQIDYNFLHKIYKKVQLKSSECSMEGIEETIIALLEVIEEGE